MKKMKNAEKWKKANNFKKVQINTKSANKFLFAGFDISTYYIPYMHDSLTIVI